ncbi:Pv-fam-d protein, partial [Plasmodium cynomolgi strain B]
ILKFLKKADAKYERFIYNILNDNIPQNAKDSLVISNASLTTLLLVLSGVAPATVISSYISLLLVLLPILLMYILHRYKKCKPLNKIYGSSGSP